MTRKLWLTLLVLIVAAWITYRYVYIKNTAQNPAQADVRQTNTLPDHNELTTRLRSCLDSSQDYVCASSVYAAYFDRLFKNVDGVSAQSQIDWLKELYSIERMLIEKAQFGDNKVLNHLLKLKEQNPKSDAIPALLVQIYSEQNNRHRAGEEARLCVMINPNNSFCQDFLNQPDKICSSELLKANLNVYRSHAQDVFSGASEPLLAGTKLNEIRFDLNKNAIVFDLNPDSADLKTLRHQLAQPAGNHILLVYQEQVIDSRDVASFQASESISWPLKNFNQAIRTICR